MLTQWLHTIKSRAWHKTSIAAIGSVLGLRGVTAATAFLTGVLVARQLQPALYGQFAKLFALMMIVMGLAGPPLDMSLVRFAARYITPERDDSPPYFALVFYVKCCMGALILVAGALMARPLVYLVFERGAESAGSAALPPAPPHAVMLAFVGGCVMTFFGFTQSFFQAHQRFARYAGFELMNALLRLGIVAVFILVGVKTAFIMLCGYVAAPAVVAVIGWSRLPRGLLRLSLPPGIGRKFFHFARWLLLAGIFTTLAQRVDILLLGYFRVPDESQGHYGAAIVLALLGELVVLTLFHVILPKASQIRTAVEMNTFVRKFRWPSILFSLGMLPALVLSGLVARMTFGEAFADTGKLFAILLISSIVTVPCVPVITSLYGLGRSHIVALLEGVRLVATVVIGVLVVPHWGVLGMAWTVSGVRAAVIVATFIAAHRELRRLRHLETTGQSG